jgi:hypothetical protein
MNVKNKKMRRWDVVLDKVPLSPEMQTVMDDLHRRQAELNDSVKDHVKRNPNELFEMKAVEVIPIAPSSI